MTNVVEMKKSVSGWVQNFVGKGENADDQHFLLFATMFFKKKNPLRPMDTVYSYPVCVYVA